MTRYKSTVITNNFKTEERKEVCSQFHLLWYGLVKSIEFVYSGADFKIIIRDGIEFVTSSQNEFHF